MRPSEFISRNKLYYEPLSLVEIKHKLYVSDLLQPELLAQNYSTFLSYFNNCNGDVSRSTYADNLERVLTVFLHFILDTFMQSYGFYPCYDVVSGTRGFYEPNLKGN